MGCDIHMFCEEYRTIDGVKKWFNADHWRLNHYYGTDQDERKYGVVELCGDRNYALFTALCGVRDYTGKSPKISEPRGLPKDCCPEVSESAEYWDADGHSHSYATLREVKRFIEENKPVIFSGLLTKEAARDLDNNGKLPESWCRWSSDKTLVFREWEDRSFQPLGRLYEKMAERFRPWIKPGDIDESLLDDFRIVFWFDN